MREEILHLAVANDPFLQDGCDERTNECLADLSGVQLQHVGFISLDKILTAHRLRQRCTVCDRGLHDNLDRLVRRVFDTWCEVVEHTA